MATSSEVFEALKPVMDPEHPVSITDPRLAIVKEDYIRVTGSLIRVLFRPTVGHCPMSGLIGILIRHRLEQVYPDAEVKVTLVPGSHNMENDVNTMISDNDRYSSIVEQLRERGMI
ncbi:MAG: iron-sulfur cluster assembly protein [Candidatus Thorarchaeota archaeon]